MDDKTRTELEAAVYRRLVEHLRTRTDVQNIDMMNLAGFCRNCLSNWMKDAADAKGVAMSKDESREIVYGMPYDEWRKKYQKEATRRAKGGIRKGQPQALNDIVHSDVNVGGFPSTRLPPARNSPYDMVGNPPFVIQESSMPATAAAEKEQPATRFAKDQLKAFVERIERLEEEKKATSDDIRDVYAEAKGNGYDVKALRTIVSLRKQDTDERREQQAVLETYMHALGMLQ